MTEIANSAFNLMGVRQTRLDRADLAEGAQRRREEREAQGLQEEDIEEDEGPIPKYPRGMLKFELSDGATTLQAIEFRSLPDFELGVTPLGYKVRGLVYFYTSTLLIVSVWYSFS